MLVERASEALGIAPDLLRIALCVVGSFPLGSLVKRIPQRHAALKDAAIIAIGLFFIAGVFPLRSGAVFMIVCSALTYVLAALFARNPHMPWANFVLQMGLMLYTHFHEQSGTEDYVNNIGISGTQMIIVQKLTSYAWNVRDGTRDPQSLSENQKEMRVTERPSFLRYLAWIFFFPTVMTGPACTYAEYDVWASGRIFGESRRQPRCGWLIVRRLAEGLVWVLLYMHTTQFSLDPRFYTRSWYAPRSFVFRATALWVMGCIFRTKYYAAWTLSEAACMHIGISYNGVDANGKARWNRMSNVSPVGVEFGQNIRGVLADWNIVTAQWLRHYVYVRVVREGKKPGTSATYMTFLVSALWHGTRPGYYLTFLTAASYQVFGRIYRKTVRPRFLGRFKFVYDVLTFFVTQYALGFAAVPFMLLDLRPAFAAWWTVYFYIFVGMFVSWLFLAGPLRQRAPSAAKKNA